ncbi:winged helix DNA-binding domain-containing protein [Nocardiopsis lucentensis]|uniref:winged helix DNA-binding domain-containing protein n=1 Tax=Nocardiopsis lucentensis TaxID=53441 RepID=UPI00034DD781|nr:winged helix DNA-binding domain-containing protein [Nocardiopsis lucentensis]
MTTTGTTLTRRALNRATLARQFLLRRVDLPVTEVVTRLAGLQAQTTHTWYVGLQNRIEGFDPHAVGRMLTDGELVRVTLMRSTLHLVTPEDMAWLRATVQAVIDRDLTHSGHGRTTRELDLDAVVAVGRELLARRPLTPTDLGARLAERWPDVPDRDLAYVVRCRLPVVQVPPRGVWGASGPPALAPADTWTGRTLDARPDPATLITRYLAAFGPASVRDVQTWSGLTRLREVVDRLRDRLIVLRGEDGAELLDLPDAPRPDPDTPAPARFLYDFDNLLRGHADRSRVISAEDLRRICARNGMPPATVLVDGEVSAAWKVVRTRAATAVEVVPFRPLTSAETDEVTAEGLRLLRFLEPDRDGHEIRVLDTP